MVSTTVPDMGSLPSVKEAIKVAGSYGISVSVGRADPHIGAYVIHAHHYPSGHSISANVSDIQYQDIGDEAIVGCIEIAVARLVEKTRPGSWSQFKETARIRELEQELARYKDVVKQLAFELEMASTSAPQATLNSNAIYAIRRAALDQASDFVMDWGVPADGRDLTELCKQIKALKETQSMAMQRAVEAMGRMFG